MTPRERAGWIIAKTTQGVIAELAEHIREAEEDAVRRALAPELVEALRMVLRNAGPDEGTFGEGWCSPDLTAA